MDSDRLEVLEKHITNLIEAFASLKEENKTLQQRVGQLQTAANSQKRELERLQPERDELLKFRTMVHNLRQEREIIRQKLEVMLVTIERLEGFAQPNEKTGV
jgi:predicted RNase H-like nuclease (RuvC/YqgF family)